MHAGVGTLLPEEIHGNVFGGLFVCVRGCLSTCTGQHASGAENKDTPVPGSKSMEVGCVLPHRIT